MSAILNVRTFPFELTVCEIALDEWRVNMRKWESIPGDRVQRFNEESSLL